MGLESFVRGNVLMKNDSKGVSASLRKIAKGADVS